MFGREEDRIVRGKSCNQEELNNNNTLANYNNN